MAAGAILALLDLAFFNPVFVHAASFSDVAGHQTVIWPWAATPTGYADNFPQSDNADTIYPWSVFAADALRDGSLPLWNPYSFGGTPFLTNGLGMALYPPRLALLLTVSPILTHDLLLISHVFLAGLAMFALLRVLRSGFLGSLLAAVAWMFSAYLFAWIQLEYVAVFSACLPATLAALALASERKSWWWATAAGIFIGLAVLGTALQLAGPLALTVGIWAVALAVRELRSCWPPSRRVAASVLLRPAWAFSLGTCLAAPVALPTLLVSRQLGRRPIPLDAMEQTAVGWGTVVKSILPPETPPTEALLNGGAVFVGTVSVGLAVVGLVSRRPGWLLGGSVALGAALVCTGTPVDAIPYHLVPGFEYLSRLGRMLVFWCFGIALLAGIGLDALLSRIRLVPNRFRPTIVAPLLGAAIIATVVGQTFSVDRKLNPPFQPRASAFTYPETDALRALKLDRDTRRPGAPQRLLPLRVNLPALYASHSMPFALESAAGYESLFVLQVANLWRVIAGERPKDVVDSPLGSSFIPSYYPDRVRFDLLQRAGVTTIYAPPDARESPGWSRRRASLGRSLYSGPEGDVLALAASSPRAFVVHRAETAHTDVESLSRFADPSFPFRSTVLLDDNPQTVPSSDELPSAAVPTARGLNGSTWVVQTRTPGYLVVLDSWAPGWTATVNGDSTAVRRADYAFRAVAVPAGRSVVRFSYLPDGFVIGLVLAGLAVGSIAFTAAFTMFRRRRRPSRVLSST